jgi:simple sugar transport system substrate-binding protein
MKAQSLRMRGVRAGGFGVLPATLKLIAEGHLAFTVDEQPYLQGFLPVLQLFLAKLSDGLVAPAGAQTGAQFVTKANVREYLVKTRFHGSSSRHRYPL